MANTYEAIQSTTLSSDQSSVTFSDIPSTYTDLVVIMSARSSVSSVSDVVTVEFNASSGTDYRTIIAYANTTLAQSITNTGSSVIRSGYSIPGNSLNSAVFGNVEFYIPNYAGDQRKTIFATGVSPANNPNPSLGWTFGLWDATQAITSIKLASLNAANFKQYSSFHLYGIKKD